MAAAKQIALGSVLKTDNNLDTIFESMTLVDEITYPPRDRELVEGKDLGDVLDVPQLGIEAQSIMEFSQFWHPNDAEHEKLDTLFDSKANVDMQIVSSHGTAVTDEFLAKVIGLTYPALTPSGLFKRTVKLLRVAASTRT